MEQDHKVVEIVRPELAERGLSDPLEFLYQHMSEFSDSERISLLSYSLEAEEQAFEVQCCVCAAYAEGRRLREFITRYNKEATAMGGKVISYQYARQMSQVGQRLRDEGKRMTQDYPALSPSYFVIALAAPDYVAALDRAQNKVAAYQEAPAKESKYTTRQFKADIMPKERPEPAVKPQAEAQNKEDSFLGVRSCYDCEHCWQPNSHQQLAVVNNAGTMAIDMVLEPCPVWICRKHRRIISVRTQIANRAEVMAKSCSSFQAKQKEEGEAQTSEAEPEEETRQDEEAVAGPALSADELDQYLDAEVVG